MGGFEAELTNLTTGEKLWIPPDGLVCFTPPFTPVIFNDPTGIRAKGVRHRTNWYEQEIEGLGTCGKRASAYYRALIYGAFVKSSERYGAGHQYRVARERFKKAWCKIAPIDQLMIYAVTHGDKVGVRSVTGILGYKLPTDPEDFLAAIDEHAYLYDRPFLGPAGEFFLKCPIGTSQVDVTSLIRHFIGKCEPHNQGRSRRASRYD